MRATEISTLLASRVESLCQHLLPNGVRMADRWHVGSVGGEAGTSMSVVVEGARTGMWIDFGGGSEDKGDLIGLWKAVRNVSLETACQEALDWLGIPEAERNGHREAPVRKKPEPKAPDQRWLDLQQTMRAGTPEELDALAELRAIPSTIGLQLATTHGHLFFDLIHDRGERHPAWLLTDGSRKNAQARKLDGSLWQFKEGRKPGKSKTIWGTDPSWPVGISEATTPEILFVEGGPDFLAAWHYIGITETEARFRPVAMFGVSNEIDETALAKFNGKTVWMFPHNDDNEAGAKGAAKWKAQLEGAGAQVETYDFKQDQVKDFNDLVAMPEGTLPLLKAAPKPKEAARIVDEGDSPVIVSALRPPSSFRIPPHSDRSVLLGNRYLNRGDGLILSGSSGIGKSSMQMQMAAAWALGTPFHGIQANGSLSSLIVQSEDSDGDIAEVWTSLNHVLQWSDEQRATLDQRVKIVTDRVSRGRPFLVALKAHVQEFKPDLVWINPLQAFIDGDVTDSKDIGAFLREGLNGLNKDCQFGYVIVHHTTKPATGKDRSERLWHEVMYDMAGGAELINWARAIISLRATETEGQFKMVLAKRGRRAGVVKMVEHGMAMRAEPTTVIGLKHIDAKLPGTGMPVIFWEPCEVAAESVKSKGGGRPEKYSFEDYRNVFPAHNSDGKELGPLWRDCGPNKAITSQVLHNCLKRWADAGHVEILRPLGRPMRYRAAV